MRTVRNQVQLIGRLGDNVELNEAGNGSKYARIRIATNEVYYNKSGEKVENTTWHSCVAWGKIAERMSQFGERGKQLLIHGKLQNNNYEDKEGVKRFTTEVQVNDFLLL